MLFLDAMTPLGAVLLSIPAILILIAVVALVAAGIRMIVAIVRKRRDAENIAEKENVNHDLP